jgi:dTDP-4-dehydrorhamnose 3,5-epimerase
MWGDGIMTPSMGYFIDITFKFSWIRVQASCLALGNVAVEFCLASRRRPVKLEALPLSLPDVKLIRSKRIADVRGYFAEAYVYRDFAAAGIIDEFVQDNQSFSIAIGTVRGLHFQTPPFAQAKLVRVLQGKIMDVVVDLRRASATFGEHLTVDLSAENGDQLYVPIGFAHGFCTLTPATEVLYKVNNVYSPAHDRGLNWADPALGIHWPVNESQAILSEKDRALPVLSALPPFFE